MVTSGRGLAISSAQEGKFAKELIGCLSRVNVHAFHKNCDSIYTELTFINP